VARPLLLKQAKETSTVESISTTTDGRSVTTAVFKQIEGGIILKKQAIKAFVLLGLFLSLSAIHVNAQNKTLVRKVEIPFDFSVRDKTFPAGAYSVTRVNQEKSILHLRSEDGQEMINIVTTTAQAKEAPKTARLIFHRYGETYFLAQIWESEDIQGRQLSKSRTERSVERDLAKRGDKPAIVDLVPSQ
jgi:hypothetical protein